MKLHRIALPLIIPLIVMLTTTGCPHKKTPPVANVRQPGPTAQPQPQTQPNLDTNPINPPEEKTTSTPVKYDGPIDTPSHWPEDLNRDRTKFAGNMVHFKYDSAVVEDGEQANVTAVAQALSSDLRAYLLIEGHCDERGTEEYNRSLGERRALALREALARDGIDPMRIRTESFGKDKPMEFGHDESAWSRNRRGEFIWCTPKAATL